MLADVVIDINVFLHAEDPREARRPEAIAFIETVLASDTHLALDEGFDIDEARNRSIVGHEYLANLTPLSLGFQALTRLVQQGRIDEKPRKVDQASARRINQLVRNKTDRTYLRVALSSDERLLCSHDFKDYPEAKRSAIRTDLEVEVLESRDAVDRC